ncbi:MAG: hypothetical protein OMM_01584 [Candidatus Magnetoglobus multicellularis str. Araruama]|uniref:Fibronectin type-III domain-containing protein n=1 Tax=Candidatus Magnetoglobus multicellularis str. Araruama TaxID=890399 RepID=A0A1V1PCN5_9BACT|nr:MAG: hypothetical protein OMM_01584 [Candidatus Magnetoglobus multicellularis str. Araruama]
MTCTKYYLNRSNLTMQNISFIKIVIRMIVFCLIYFGFIQSAFADRFSSTTVENFLGIPKLHSPKNSFSPSDGSFTIQSTAQDISRMNLFIDIKGIDAESRTYHWVSSVYAVKPDESTYTPITFNTSHASHTAYSMTFSPEGTFYRAVADISTWKTGSYTIYFSLDNGYNQQLSDIFIDRTISTRKPNGYGCPIPDFAEIACFDNTKEIDCPASNHSLYGQDGNYLINKASYIKMDTNGHDLPDHASSWSMVRDTVTGLIWEIKQMADGAMDYSNPTDGDNVYTWYDPDNPLNTGVENNQRNTNAFINQLNQIQWGGFNHWRMPTIQELETLINHSETEPAIAQVFTPTQKNQYWSSTTAAYAMMARGIDFNNGINNLYQKSSQFYVRAVVGPTCQRRFVDNDETITDTCTGLVWEKHASDSIYSWENSLEFCNNKETAGFSDWRLPSKQELRTIIDYSSKNPAIDTTLFQNQKADQYWTSTSNIASQNQAWAVNFQFAEDISDSKTTPKYVRAVRGGQPQDQNKLFIHSPALASQWFVGDKMAIQWETQSIEGYVNIYLSLKGGANHTFDLIATPSNDGQYTWIVSGQATDNAVIKIEPVASPELSSQLGMFSIDLPKQIFSLSPSSVTLALNDPVALTLVYDTNDNNKTFGAGIRFHYNANILAFTGFSYTLNEHLIETRPPEPDTDNYDNDDSTDTFVYLKWQHIYPDWPISPMPLNLAILNFVTIESGTSPVNMSTQFAETAYTQITHNAHIISKNQPPDIQIQSIVQRTDGSGFLDIVFMGKDAENDIVHWDLEKCGYALDDSNNFSSIVFQSPVDYMAFSETDSMYTAVINASDWNDGVYQIKLAVDNEHVPTTYSPVHVDNTPPNITVDCGEGPGKSCLKEDNAFSLHGNCSDDTESIIINQSGQSIDWLPDGEEWFYPVSLASIPEHAYTSVTYSYTIVAYDRFGNRGVSDVIHVKRIPKNEITISQIDPLVLPENTAQQRIIVSISSNIAGSMAISCDYPPQSIIADIELSSKTLTFQASETIDLTLTIVPVNGRFGSETVTLVCKDKYDRSDSMSFPIEIIEGNWWFREYAFQWVDICTISKNNVFAIDRNGAIYQFNGQFWKPLRVDYEPLTAIWGDNNDVYAVGDNGYIIHYNGMEWSAMAGNTTEHLRDIWGTGTGYLYAVSSEGTIFKYDNSQWEKAFETKSFPLTAIWGSSSTNIYAVGNGGTIVHFDNTQWHFIESPTNEHLTNIWGSQKDNVYAIGENGTIIHYDGHNWSIENSPSASTLTGIWGVDETTVFAVGYSGTILQKITDQWQELPQQSENLNAISGTDANHIIVAGDHGMMLSFENNQWTQTASPLTAWSQMTHVTQMTAIWGISDMCIFASGLYQDDSVIFQYNGQQWERSIINDSRIVSIWGSSKQDVFAVADNGQIFHYDGHNWTVQETDFHLNAVWGASPSDVFAVGHGIILNFDGHSWKQMLNEQSHTLNAIWGRSYQDIYAVGNNGVILHYNGTDWQAMTNTDGSDLFTIQGNNTQVYAGGKNGLLSYENQTWVAVDINFQNTIIDMSPTVEGEWFVIGSKNIWQYSPEDSQFSTIYNSEDLVMKAIWGSLSINRYIIADNGIILHHKENKAPESPNQKHFLQALYTQTLGNQWTVSPLWQISESECAWSGITCNASQQIISIDLNQKSLAGTLPQSIDLISNIEYLFLQGNALHGSVPAQIKSLTDLADNQSDFRYNALYTDDPEIRTFLNQKQIDGSWENTQTIAPSNISAQAGYRGITLTWNPIAYSWDEGYYEIFYRPKSNASLPYSTVTTMDKTVSSVSLPDLSSDTDFEIRMRSVTKNMPITPMIFSVIIVNCWKSAH